MLTVLSAASQAVAPFVQDVRLGERVVVERELGDEVLAGADVLHALVARVLRVGGEEHVVAGGPANLPKVETIAAWLPLPM